MGVDLGVEGDCDCGGMHPVDMRLFAGASGGEQSLRSCCRKKGALRHVDRCSTGDIDKMFNVLSARIVEANGRLLIEEYESHRGLVHNS